MTDETDLGKWLCVPKTRSGCSGDEVRRIGFDVMTPVLCTGRQIGASLFNDRCVLTRCNWPHSFSESGANFLAQNDDMVQTLATDEGAPLKRCAPNIGAAVGNAWQNSQLARHFGRLRRKCATWPGSELGPKAEIAAGRGNAGLSSRSGHWSCSR
jgi:hypothetical protein